MALGWNKIWYFLCSPLRFLQPNVFRGKAVWSSMWAAFQGKQQGPSLIEWWKLERNLHFKAVGRCTWPWAAFPGELLELTLPEPSCPRVNSRFWLEALFHNAHEWGSKYGVILDASKYAPSLCGPLRPRPSHIVPWWAEQTAIAGEPFIAEPWGLQAEGRTQYSTFFLARSPKISRRQDSRYSVPGPPLLSTVCPGRLSLYSDCPLQITGWVPTVISLPTLGQHLHCCVVHNFNGNFCKFYTLFYTISVCLLIEQWLCLLLTIPKFFCEIEAQIKRIFSVFACGMSLHTRGSHNEKLLR